MKVFAILSLLAQAELDLGASVLEQVKALPTPGEHHVAKVAIEGKDYSIIIKRDTLPPRTWINKGLKTVTIRVANTGGLDSNGLKRLIESVYVTGTKASPYIGTSTDRPAIKLVCGFIDFALSTTDQECSAVTGLPECTHFLQCSREQVCFPRNQGNCVDGKRCDKNQHVSGGTCKECKSGTTHYSKDLIAGGDTTCKACAKNFHLSDGTCKKCKSGTKRSAVDYIGGDNTTCDACADNFHVSDGTCKKCKSGTKRSAGDPIAGGNTDCYDCYNHDHCTELKYCNKKNNSCELRKKIGEVCDSGECEEGLWCKKFATGMIWNANKPNKCVK